MKYNKVRQPGFLSTSWDAWKAVRAGPPGIVRRQRERLSALVSYARTHSRYFANRYQAAAEPCTDIRQLPIVTKAELMRHFSWYGTSTPSSR
jgi:phenylacetate-CoA ligase